MAQQMGNGNEEEVQKACEYLDQTVLAAASASNHVKTQCEKLKKLCEQKLWHQLSLLLEECVGDADFQRIPGLLLDLYTRFVSLFALRLNALKLVHIIVKVSQQHTDPTQAIVFLDTAKLLLEDSASQKNSFLTQIGQQNDEENDGEKKKTPLSPEQLLLREPILFLDMAVGQLSLQAGNMDKAKQYMEEGIKMLDQIEEVDPSVIASVYSLSSQYHKVHRNFDEFYKSSLLYLSYVSTETLPGDYKLSLAVDVSLAALLGEGVLNFGELLLHPIVTALVGTDFEWLHALLKCFNKGDMHAYDMICERYADALNMQPELVKKAESLRSKITLLCLVEYLFSLPPENRSVPLDEIASRAKLASREEAEVVIMKAMAQGMLKGLINQVAGVIQVEWVQPRVLTHDQVRGLATRLEHWSTKLTSTQKFVGSIGQTC
jgi:26S proteasome regulatory subunit N9